MRILGFSDLHRNRDAARDIVVASQDADIVVGAGDFATQGVGLRDTVDLLRAVAVPTVLVAGNHDDLDELRDACRVSASIHVLHGEAAIVEGISFFGLGFEIPRGSGMNPGIGGLGRRKPQGNSAPARKAQSSSPIRLRSAAPMFKGTGLTKAAAPSATPSCRGSLVCIYAATSITPGAHPASLANAAFTIWALRRVGLPSKAREAVAKSLARRDTAPGLQCRIGWDRAGRVVIPRLPNRGITA